MNFEVARLSNLFPGRVDPLHEEVGIKNAEVKNEG
jgi:hypothetical protein